MRKMNLWVGLAAVLAVALLLGQATTAFAQSTTDGAVGGTVSDPQGAVVAGATIVIHNNGTNQEFTVTSDGIGYFRQGGLQPNTYKVTVTATGFATTKIESVVVNVGSLTSINPKLTLGASENVEVSAEVPLLNTTSAEIAPTLNTEAIQNLPINGGRWSSFTMLTPGIVSDSNGFGLVSVRGISPLLNNVTVDGADNNQAYFSEERGRTRAGYSTPKVAVQEFQVNTTNYSAEYGRAAGAVVNTITKSGSNNLHGEAFWMDRDNQWGSTNPYTTRSFLLFANGTTAPPTGVETKRYKPTDVRKMGGFAIGGPIIQDKLFFFLAFDKFHRNFPGTAVPSTATFFNMPDATLPSGITCGGTGAAAPSTADANVCTFMSNTSKSAVPITTYAAAATLWNKYMYGSGSTLGLISDSGSTPRTGDQDILFPRFDWLITPKHHLSVEVNRMRWWSPAGIQTQATNTYGISTFGNDYVATTWGVAKFDSAITSHINNQLRFQYGRDFEYQTWQKASAYDAANLISSSNPYGRAPQISLSGGFTFGSTIYGNRVKYPDEYKWQIADSVNMTAGRHNISFGVDWVKNIDKIQNLYNQLGSYSYNSAASYFADLYDPTLKKFTTFSQGFQGTSTANAPQTYEFATNDFAFFAQDSWKATSRLTLNAGIRFEDELLPSPFASIANSVTLGSKTYDFGKLPSNPYSFGPRVGFAWDVYGKGKTVLRGGYGIYFGRLINSTIYSAMANTGSMSSTLSQPSYSISSSSSTAPLFPNILSAAPASGAGLTLNYLDPNFKLPQIHEFDLAVQQDLGWKTVLSINYMGSLGRHMQAFSDLNLAAPGTAYWGCKTSGQQAASSASCTGTGNSYLQLTPSAQINYTLSNLVSGNAISGMPLSSDFAVSTPFYTSRLNPNYGAVIEAVSNVNSSYHALVAQLEKRMSDHVQFSINYTWSHALDNGVNGLTGFNSSPTFVDPLNSHYSVYGNSNYNVPNRLTIHAVLESPWKAKGPLKYVADGWQLAPVVQLQNGIPYSVTTYGFSAAQIDSTGQKYSAPASAYGMLGANGSYQIPGTARNGFKQPNTAIYDLRFSKRMTLKERYKFEFSAEGFNILNHNNTTGITTTQAYTMTLGTTAGSQPVLTPYTSQIGGATGSQYTYFGVPNTGNSNFVYSTRQIQLGGKITF